jgi:hypothetical protein
MDSGTAITTEVTIGGDPSNNRPFSQLSQSGKMVNAYNAMVMAEKLAKKPAPVKIKG